MYGYFTPILILQAFCLLHAYRNHTEQRWYWLILFFPGIGCLMYLYHNFYNQRSIATISEGFKGIVNTNRRTVQLEQAYKFSDNLANRLNLADEYQRVGRHDEAIELYKLSLVGFMANDPAIKLKLLRTYFLNEDYTSAVSIGSQLKTETHFNNSEERIFYAWSFHYLGQDAQAEEVFEDMNKPYRNYKARIEFGKFLKEINKIEEAKDLLNELLEEFSLMKPHEKRINRSNTAEVKGLLGMLERSRQKA